VGGLLAMFKGLIGFIKGKRSSGYFSLMDIFNNTVTTSVNIKRDCQRLVARKTTLTGAWQFLPLAKDQRVSLPQNIL